jgi:hypothetical protein
MALLLGVHAPSLFLRERIGKLAVLWAVQRTERDGQPDDYRVLLDFDERNQWRPADTNGPSFSSRAAALHDFLTRSATEALQRAEFTDEEALALWREMQKGAD